MRPCVAVDTVVAEYPALLFMSVKLMSRSIMAPTGHAIVQHVLLNERVVLNQLLARLSLGGLNNKAPLVVTPSGTDSETESSFTKPADVL